MEQKSEGESKAVVCHLVISSLIFPSLLYHKTSRDSLHVKAQLNKALNSILSQRSHATQETKIHSSFCILYGY